MIKRMTDAEFISELYVAMLLGLQDKKKILDTVYFNYSSMESDDFIDLEKNFKKIIKIITNIFNGNLQTTSFNGKMHYYSLFYVIYDLMINKNIKIPDNQYQNIYYSLVQLSQNITNGSNDDMKQYREELRQGGDTLGHRQFRHNILLKIIEPFCIKRDSNRNFSKKDKKLLWNGVDKKTCGICDEIIDNYDDCEIDHIIAYSNGGLTTLNNGQLAHSNCNKSKGNKPSK